MLRFLFEPQDGINYRYMCDAHPFFSRSASSQPPPLPHTSHGSFIYYCYSACSAIFAVLAVADLQFKVESVKGFYIIFAPFLPCWVWCVVLKAAAARKAALKAKKE